MLKRVIADNLSRIKYERRLTQAKMAEAIGISLRFYQALETGDQNPSMETIEKIILGLNIPAAELFEDPRVKAAEDKPREHLLMAYQELEKENKRIKDLVGALPESLIKKLASPKDPFAIVARAWLTGDLQEIKDAELEIRSKGLLRAEAKSGSEDPSSSEIA